MAKKNIISDFGSLKGKLDFLEKTPLVQTPEQKTKSKAETKTSRDRELKVGNKVVLMDSDFRGTIVSLGRTVGIELEDGLTIQAAYGEFAVTDDSEISALKQSKVKAKKTAAPAARQTAPSGILTVDLHIEAIPGGRSVPKGQQLQFQMDTFRRIIRENLSHKGMKINFVHGVGDGILKSAIRTELDEVLALRCTYSVGDPAVTVVSIR
ncbi:MAG: Smr/MutS family protein [Bacteroidales bacterium]|nr:Smr/MutS family protein [Bacteroidales bacterium]